VTRPGESGRAAGVVTRPADRAVLSILFVVVAAPVAVLALRALSATWFYPEILPPAGSMTTLVALASDARLWRAGAVSAVLAAATGVGAATIALAAGRVIARAPKAVRTAAGAAALLPVIAPPIALGVGLQVVALRAYVSGTFWGVLFAHLVPATGYLTLYFLGVLSAYDWSLEDEARTLGAAPHQVLARVALPVLRPRLVEAVVLGALISWAQLALTLVVGAGAVRTLPVELLALVRSGDDRLAAAAALALTVPPALAVSLLARGARRTGTVA